MNRSDKHAFADLFDSVADYYRVDRLAPAVKAMYFSALEGYTLEQVRAALDAHMRDGKRGQYFPKVADLVHQQEAELTVDKVIALARLNNTPLGAIFRLHIGSFDLANADPFRLKQRAEECLLLLPQLLERARAGEYTDHELRVMLKYGIDAQGPAAPGLPAPQVNLAPRLAQVDHGPAMARLIAPAEDYTEDEGESGAEAARQARQQLQRVLAALPDGSGSTTA